MRSVFHPNPDSSVTIRFDKRNTFSLEATQAILAVRGIEASLSSSPRDGVMIYSMATPQAREVYHEVENAQTQSVFIAGGPHPSANASEALEQFVFVVLGEGEETLPELIFTLKDDSDPEKVRGIAYKRAGIIYKTPPRPHVVLDDYPPFNQNLRAPIEISRGCHITASTVKHRVSSAQKCAIGAWNRSLSTAIICQTLDLSHLTRSLTDPTAAT